MVAFFEWVRRLIETSDIWVESEGSQTFEAWFYGICLGVLLIIWVVSETRKKQKDQ
jgi:hypothetical protein